MIRHIDHKEAQVGRRGEASNVSRSVEMIEQLSTHTVTMAHPQLPFPVVAVHGYNLFD